LIFIGAIGYLVSGLLRRKIGVFLKFILLFFLSVFVFTSAKAAPRPDSRKFSCSDLVAIVEQNGAVVFAYGENLYSRFVSNGSYCAYGEIPLTAQIPSLDKEKCFVGYVCINRER
jgi:hypothetical protein